MRRLPLVVLNCILIAALASASIAPAQAQDGGEDAFIADLFSLMSSEEKIGQLFVVAFDGTDTSDASGIADLILNYHVGGVILTADHGNIVDSGDRTPAQVARLTSSLQLLAARAGVQSAPYIPLFVALEQDGGGPAYGEITAGLTPQPSPMALGATWDPIDAQEIGRVVGDELSALGINFLIGPSLDVLTQPASDGGDIGVHAFGGDPYWVGTMAGAYARGLSEGSGGRIAVVAKHFPGEGGLFSDADTIDRSLDQLQRVDLEPYFRLMQIPAGELRPTIGAVQTSHARIRGFRDRLERTDPISVDASALATLLNLPAVSAWRDAGGLMVSGSLGALPLRRYYDQTGTTFPAEQIALDAFLAGNDLLILNDFSLTGAASAEQQTILATIRTFQQRYREDLDFQDRVDRAVKRILRLKFRLFPGFQAADATAVPDALDARLGQGLPAVERVAQDSLARLYPSDAQVEAAPLSVPSPEESFLIFTDDRLVVDCTRCPERATLFTTAISQTLTRVAGVPAKQITSLGFADLKAFLAGAPSAQNLNLPELFAQASWIILAEQNLQSDVQQSDAARLLLRERRDLIAGKRVTLFAFGPPYGLSTEDLAPITAGYYAMYSIGQPFVDVAVAALAGQMQPVSSPPVSVAAIDYDLATQIEPDPDQLLRIFVGEAEAGPGTPTPGPPSYRVGDDIRIRTDLILDRNGHPVPDGTPVRFTVVYRDAGDVSQRIDGLTVDGAAAIVFAIANNGRMEIGAVSEPVLSSVRLQLTIAEEGVTIVQTVVPRPPATPTRLPTATSTLAPTATPTPTPIALVDSLLGAEPRRANLIDLALSLLGVTLVGAWGYRVESRRKVEDAVDRAVRLVLWGSLSGLAVYTGYAVGLPGADALRAAFGGWTALIVTLVGAVAPWVLDRALLRSRND
jgi:beta-N-acetylhexosaminidase